MNALKQLQDWYHAECNGDWEHSFGVKIETLDNPGWLLTIDLEDTSLEDAPFADVSYGTGKENESESDDWIDCKVADKKFKAAGGPHKLEEMLTVFLRWKMQCARNCAYEAPPAHEAMHNADRNFYDELGPEDAARPCKSPGCTRGSVRFSVLCRVHHFESVSKRPCPFND